VATEEVATEEVATEEMATEECGDEQSLNEKDFFKNDGGSTLLRGDNLGRRRVTLESNLLDRLHRSVSRSTVAAECSSRDH